MMASYSETDDQSFITCDESSFSNSRSDWLEDCMSSTLGNCALDYEFWTKEPNSVDERRANLLRWLGLGSDGQNSREDNGQSSYHKYTITDPEETAIASQNSQQYIFSSCSFQPFHSHGSSFLLEDEDLNPKTKSLANGKEFAMDEPSNDGSPPASCEVGLKKLISLDEFQKLLCSSSLVRHFLREDIMRFNIMVKKSNWFQKFSAISHIMDRTKRFLCKPARDQTVGPAERLRVNVCQKQSKELSSLYSGQEFTAHTGSILTMKFSPDGLYLASAGVDGVVRVWKVLEEDVLTKFNAQVIDPSCLNFSLNHFSKLTPLDILRKRDDFAKSLEKPSDSACVVFPPKSFQLSEKPVHEFHGHTGEVLALSWRKDGHLLSSSVDKTARMWRVGNDQCQGVYLHNNYVTCVEFSPVDDNHFISGSIDGKVRIWELESGRVVDWVDIGEMVTAIGFSPDGKGGIVGSMDGNCLFYDIIGNRFQVGASIYLKGKKNMPGNRIIGFQYCPNDANKLMVTSADSRVRILCGTTIVCNFKGNRNSATQVPASFTSDGQHLVSATEDSYVRIWNYTTEEEQKSSQEKKLKSYESFFSRNASIAVPWYGWKEKLGALPSSILRNEKFPNCFTLGLGFVMDTLYKGSMTWPEERLPQLNTKKLKFLKSAFSNAPHLWGLVIVTAGWDGCIRTFLNYGLPLPSSKMRF
ncbi:Transducin/WD40 repeat-like superfamily protein [Striga hermonthica]|uniref:Transducin/WD40 repeat-like superfamily protein n=1 Tax=Striga hermonthica TaxID=68872 RepID=A0A9N7N909_STRHE|nr:Transducin/WD40 repeat-like superfamily protein [Striga hermonthica]